MIKFLKELMQWHISADKHQAKLILHDVKTYYKWVDKRRHVA